MRKLSELAQAQIRLACVTFFQSLQEHDLHAQTAVFEILDEVARKQGYMICAKQRGIFGTTLHFQHQLYVE